MGGGLGFNGLPVIFLIENPSTLLPVCTRHMRTSSEKKCRAALRHICVPAFKKKKKAPKKSTKKKRTGRHRWGLLCQVAGTRGNMTKGTGQSSTLPDEVQPFSERSQHRVLDDISPLMPPRLCQVTTPIQMMVKQIFFFLKHSEQISE